MQNKTILITGGNTGIGMHTAIGLAQKGATVVISSRSTEKGQRAVQEIRRRSGQEQVHYLPLDLASFRSIESFANQFSEKYSHLDVLINNAGLITSDFQTTEEGFEKQIGVNHIGHFLLTQKLLDKLQAAPAPRVINVSSVAHLRGKIDYDSFRQEPEDYFIMNAYGQSKLANILFTRELSRRYPEIEAYCLHPGGVRTSFGNKHAAWYVSLFWTLAKPFLISPKKGAQTSIFLASTEEVPAENGQYFDEHQRVRRPSPAGRDDALARELWERTEGMIAEAKNS